MKLNNSYLHENIQTIASNNKNVISKKEFLTEEFDFINFEYLVVVDNFGRFLAILENDVLLKIHHNEYTKEIVLEKTIEVFLNQNFLLFEYSTLQNALMLLTKKTLNPFTKNYKTLERIPVLNSNNNFLGWVNIFSVIKDISFFISSNKISPPFYVYHFMDYYSPPLYDLPSTTLETNFFDLMSYINIISEEYVAVFNNNNMLEGIIENKTINNFYNSTINKTNFNKYENKKLKNIPNIINKEILNFHLNPCDHITLPLEYFYKTKSNYLVVLNNNVFVGYLYLHKLIKPFLSLS